MLLACAERAGVVDQNWDRDAERAGNEGLPEVKGPLDAVAANVSTHSDFFACFHWRSTVSNVLEPFPSAWGQNEAAATDAGARFQEVLVKKTLMKTAVPATPIQIRQCLAAVVHAIKWCLILLVENVLLFGAASLCSQQPGELVGGGTSAGKL